MEPRDTKDRRLILALIAFGFRPEKVERLPKDNGGFHLSFTFDSTQTTKVDLEEIIAALKALGDEPSCAAVWEAYSAGKQLPLPDVGQYAKAEEVWRTNLFQ